MCAVMYSDGSLMGSPGSSESVHIVTGALTASVCCTHRRFSHVELSLLRRIHNNVILIYTPASFCTHDSHKGCYDQILPWHMRSST